MLRIFQSKLLFAVTAIVFFFLPITIDPLLGLQQRAEMVVHNFLSKYPTYMGLYFSDIDTAYMELNEQQQYRDASSYVQQYQDSTSNYSHINFSKADSFYNLYKKWSLKKDSMRIHYKPQPLGWLLIHHYQLDNALWTDSFMVDFSCRKLIHVRGTEQ